MENILFNMCFITLGEIRWDWKFLTNFFYSRRILPRVMLLHVLAAYNAHVIFFKRFIWHIPLLQNYTPNFL